MRSTLQFGVEVAELVRDFRRGDGVQIGFTETFDGQCLTVPPLEMPALLTRLRCCNLRAVSSDKHGSGKSTIFHQRLIVQVGGGVRFDLFVTHGAKALPIRLANWFRITARPITHDIAFAHSRLLSWR
jgi:hypothetical protein